MSILIRCVEHLVIKLETKAQYLVKKATTAAFSYLFLSVAAFAQDLGRQYEFRIGGGELGPIMDQVHEVTRLQLLYSSDLADTEGLNPLQGSYTVEQALKEMLQGTGLTSCLTESGMIVIIRGQCTQFGGGQEIMSNENIKRSFLAGIISSLLFGANDVAAQENQDSDVANEAGQLNEIIVTARRRTESLQEVPLTVNAVTGEDLTEFNIRTFEDISAMVPGLTVGGQGPGGGATLRGMAYSAAASGNNGTVEFYRDDVPISSLHVLGQMFDIGQIEVLRGPQGTLRGRASPSGSITITSRRPDLHELGGYIDIAGFNPEGANATGAVGVPIIPDMLAVRVAGIYDWNRIDDVESINGRDPFRRTYGGRASVRFEPTSDLAFNAIYEKTRILTRQYDQVESARVVDPDAPPSPVFIHATDRLAVEDEPSFFPVDREILIGQGRWSFAGQQLNYVGGITTEDNPSRSRGPRRENDDIGNFFGPEDPAILNTAYSPFNLFHSEITTHEIRLSSEARLFGSVDYTVGAFFSKRENEQDFFAITVLYNPILRTARLAETQLFRNSDTRERSFFGNLTFHLGEATELAGGLRRIYYERASNLLLGDPPTPLPGTTLDDDYNATIYTASIKHEFSDDLMVYALIGSSWRPGNTVIGNFSVAPSARELEFTHLESERSKSYEVGFKSTFLDNRLRLNVSAFHQEFDDTPFRPSTPQFYVTSEQNPAGPPGSTVQSVDTHNFAASVPAKVTGVEAEIAYSSENFDIGASVAYAKGTFSNVTIPCNDFNPTDGVPDGVSPRPTVDQIIAATGTTLAACSVSGRASPAPLWSGTIHSEYRLPIFENYSAFLRGLLTLADKTENDPANPFDDHKAYAILNAYAGVRSPDDAWELSIYAKNITEVERITRGQSVLTTSYRDTTAGFAAVNGVTGYRSVSMATGPREFGVNLRYSFGSR